MPQPMPKVEYYEYKPALSSRISKEKVNLEDILDDYSLTWPKLRQMLSPHSVEPGFVMFLDKKRRQYLLVLSLLEIDHSSVMSYFGTTSETFLIRKTVEEDTSVDIHVAERITGEKDSVLTRLSRILDELIEGDEIFKEIDKTEIMGSLSVLVEKSPQNLKFITDDELTQRIEKIILIEVMSGILNDLSPAEMESFEAATKRREFFK